MSGPDRYFRLLLRLLPSSFRLRHGDAVAQEFEQMEAELGNSPGLWSKLRLYAAVTFDLMRHAAFARSSLGRTALDERRELRVSTRAGGADFVESLRADSRFALRQFGRRWGTTVTMLAILSIGMSVSILMFSFLESYATLPPRGVPLSEDVVRIRGVQTSPIYGAVVRTFTEEEIDIYKELTGHFEGVTAWADASVTVDAPAEGGIATAKATLVTGDYFGVLGVRPALGRELPGTTSDDPALDRVAVIGHGTWDRLFGRDPDVVGRILNVNGLPVTVAGVAPPGFMGVNMLTDHQVWMPLSNSDAILPAAAAENLAFRAAARLRSGVTHEAATAAVAGVAQRMMDRADLPLAGESRDPTADVVPMLSANGDPNFGTDVRRLVISLGILGLLVLLVTCTNVSALLMSLAAARRQEIVVRISLGAGRKRVIRQLLTESAMLAVVAGGAALAAATLVVDAVMSRFPQFPTQMGVSPAAVAFTFGIALAAGVLFGLAPALHATGIPVSGALRDSSASVTGGRLRLQRALVVAQVAFTQPLVVGLVAVLLMVVGEFQPTREYASPERLVSLQLHAAAVDPGGNFGSGNSVQPLEELVPGLRAELESLPGIVAAVPASSSVGEIGTYQVHPDDAVSRTAEQVRPVGNTAAPGYFATVGLRLVRGREFRPGDVDVRALGERGAPVPIVIGSRLAARLWRGADPLGRRLQPVGDSAATAAELVVAGVAEEPETGGRRGAEAPQVYVAADPTEAPRGLMIRTGGEAQPLVPLIQRTSQAHVPGWTPRVETVAAIEDESRSIFRGITRGLLASGLVALLLSAIGLYAVMAFSVGQRAREIAVRMAVGAPAERVAGRFVAEGLRLGTVGMLIGLPISMLALHVLNAAALEGMSDYPGVGLPQVALVAVLVVVLTAAVATLVPAGRAAGLDPAQVLRRP